MVKTKSKSKLMQNGDGYIHIGLVVLGGAIVTFARWLHRQLTLDRGAVLTARQQKFQDDLEADRRKMDNHESRLIRIETILGVSAYCASSRSQPGS